MLSIGRRAVSLAVAVLVLSLLPGPPALAEQIRAEPSAPPQVSTPVGVGKPRAAAPSPSDTASRAVATRRLLPQAGSAEVLTTSGQPVTVGGLPLTVTARIGEGADILTEARNRPGDFVSGPARVRVEVADHKVAAAAGVSGAVLSVSQVDTEDAGGGLTLAVDYSAFAELFGGDYGHRLRLVALPGCALRTPTERECQTQQELPSVNRSGWLSSDLTLTAGAGPLVMAVISGASSPGATFEASSLSPAYSWSAGSQGGSFSWRYPLKAPASLGGPAPELAIAYDSGGVDGQTLAANGQASWVGEGWDLSTGYIERSYRSCAQDGGTSNVGDLCWFSGYNATMTFAGRSYKLVRDNATGVWKTDDDGSLRIEQLFDMSNGNGDDDGEYWRVTTLDGTQYFFGKHKRYPTDPQTTDSVQRVPVWGNNPGEPCAANTWCLQGYRWNLDYVIDLRGNSMTYFYTKFTGNYGFNGNLQTVAYDIHSTLDHIDYGTRAGSEGSGLPPQRVIFTKAYRCQGACVVGSADFPDTPWDLHCAQASCPSQTSPSFWNPYRLASVTTQVRKADGSGMRRVDQWNLGHDYPSTGDNILPTGVADTSPNLWLQTLTHVGYAEDDVTALAEPTISFGGVLMANRVDWGNDIGVAPYMHYRLRSINNGVGGQTLVSYSVQDCPLRSLKPAPGFNPFRCFPQFYKPAQASPGYGWFHKYVATEVTEVDLSPVNAPDETWSYSYTVGAGTDTSLWAHDYNETSLLAYRTWSQWRGYNEVTTTHGPAGGVQTVSKKLFYRGLHGDSLATVDNQAMAWESRTSYLTVPITVPGQTGAIGSVGGRCWDTVGGSAANGTAVHLWDCHGYGSQQWRYNLDTLTFKNLNSNRCLQAMGTANSSAVQIRDCTGGTAQTWVYQPDGSLRNLISGRCLITTGWGLANGTLLAIWDCLGVWSQVWQQSPAGTVFSPQSRRCIDALGTADQSMVATWTCYGPASQQWTYQSSGSSLKNPVSGKCLDVASSGTANGSLVQLYTCNNTGAQIWVAQADGTLKNPQSGRCLDALSPPAHGTQLAIWDCNAGATQQFAHQITDALSLGGQPREEFTLDGPSTVLASTIHTYTQTLTGTRSTPAPGGQDLRAYQTRETNTKARTQIAATSSWRWTNADTTYDSYGLPVDARNYADMAIASDDTCTHTDYNRNLTSYLINTAKETITTTCATTPTDADYLGGTHVFYDGATSDTAPTLGLPTRSNLLSSVVGGVKAWTQTTRNVYDSHGRVLDSFDALNRKTSTAYTPASGAPITSFTVTGPMGAGWVTTTALEPGHGTTKSATDINGKATTATYDPLGRLAKVWLDNRSTAGTPNRQYTYLLANPSWVQTQTLGPNGNQISSYDIFDGRLRPRQTQSTAPDGKRTITDTRYDGRGLTAKQTTFYNGSSGPAAQIVAFSDIDVPRQLRFVYDTLGRKTKDQIYNANVFQFDSTTFYDGDRIGTVPPTGGTATQDLSDVRGNVIEKRQYQSGSLSGTFAKTLYGYDRLSRLTSMTDPANNQWVNKYDLLGRKTETTDPDAGISSTAYDDAGQATSTTDARGQRLFFEYDLLGRKTIQRADTATGPVLASSTYDTLAKGQLTSASRFQGTDTYTSAVTSYDDGYRPLSTIDTIPGFGAGGATLSYQVNRTFRSDGTPATVALPGVGGLPAETLTYTYTDQGMPDTVSSGQAVYVADTVHDYEGLIVEQRLGAVGKQVKLTNQFDPTFRRLQAQSVYTESPTTVGDFGLMRHGIDYGYDRVGNIVFAATYSEGVRDQAECFRYDYLRRLTESWVQPSIGAGCVTPQRAGSDPYWRQWTFDSVGNRLTQTDKNPTAGDSAWTYQVGAAGAVKPHQVKQITSTGPLASPTRTFTYDPSGNTLSRTTDTGAAQTLTWDKEGHLASLTDTGVTTTYVYDPSGRRLVSSAPTKKTLYLPDGTELEKLGTADPLGRRHYGTAVRDATGLKWVFANHQASSTVQIDAITLTVARRRFLPYGEPRGPQPSGWLGSKGFVNGTKDDTGLTHLGAREYDPGLGRFISVDPIMDLTDPQQWHAYSYANASPVINSDPSGALKKEASEKGAVTRPVLESIGRGLFNGWRRVNSAPIEGAWSMVTGMYQQTKSQYEAVINGEKSIGQAYFDWQMYSASMSIQALISPITTVQEMIVEGSRAIDDAKSGDWQAAAEHATVASADFAYTVTTVVAAGQGLKALVKGGYKHSGETPTNLHAFGNASGPRAPREGIDFHVGDDGMVIPQSGPSPLGASTFGDPAHAPLSGPYHVIPGGTRLPRGFGVVADGEDVLPGSGQPPTHHTIYPTEPMTPQDFIDDFLGLPWTRAGKK
ncbi:ricin-type beta-trefoil lectin domain protein [Rhizocola hellebori]|nr:ricin-type beta-trefoil lectin domain protein [Rhizocola hellebori]